VTELAYEYHAWEKEISSWKCGMNVWMKLFYDVRNTNLMGSGGPGSSNFMMDENDLASGISVGKEPHVVVPGTLFSKKGCHGHSHIIRGELVGTTTIEEMNDSGRVYEDPGTWKSYNPDVTKWDPMSVWLNDGTEVEMFQDDDFETVNTLSVKRPSDAPTSHGRHGKCYNFADIAPRLKDNDDPAGKVFNWSSLHFRKYIDLLN
jgi:hypothetical protein